jgi:hypothetical protein
MFHRDQFLEQERDVEQTRGALTVHTITGTAGGGGRCEQCQFIDYESKTSSPSSAVIVYTTATPIDLSSAKRIVFFAKGELSGETIKALTIGKSSESGSSTRTEERQATVGAESTEPTEKRRNDYSKCHSPARRNEVWSNEPTYFTDK